MKSEPQEWITVQVDVQAPMEKVWRCWTQPDHIVHWNFASEDWCCPAAVNDLRPGQEFSWRMESRDGKTGFDFTGTYHEIIHHRSIAYTLADGRSVQIRFEEKEDGVLVQESFEAEGTHTDEMQRSGWQAILHQFKNYVESLA